MTINFDHKKNRITTALDVDNKGITIVIDNTGSITLPKGSTIERPISPVSGDFRFSRIYDRLEYYDGNDWNRILVVQDFLSGTFDRLVDSSGNLILLGVSYFTSAAYPQLSNSVSGILMELSGTANNIGFTFRTKNYGVFRIANTTGDIIVLENFGNNHLSIKDGTFTNTVSSTTKTDINAFQISNITPQDFWFDSRGYVGIEGSANPLLSVETSGYPVFRVYNSSNFGYGILVESQNTGTFLYTTKEIVFWTPSVFTVGNTTGNNAVKIHTSGLENLVFTTLGSSHSITFPEILNFVGLSSNPILIDFSMKRVAGVDDPIDPYDVVNKKTAEEIAASLFWKHPARVATSGNITLFGLQTIDGVTLVSGDRVLVRDQMVQQNNGIYVVTPSSWYRSWDFDSSTDIKNGNVVYVKEGNDYGNTVWILTSPNPITLGTDPIIWTQMAGYQSVEIEGHNGIQVFISGRYWQIRYDTDEYTITKGAGPGGVLSVFAPASVSSHSVLIAPNPTPGAAIWDKANIGNPSTVSGVLPVVYGGTGRSSVPAEALLVGTDTLPLRIIPIGSPGRFLKIVPSGVAREPVWASASFYDLGDIAVSAPTSGNFLIYSSGNWINVSFDDFVSARLGKVGTDVSDNPDYLSYKIRTLAPLTAKVSSGTSKNIVLGIDYGTGLFVYSSSLAIGNSVPHRLLVSQGLGTPAVWNYIDILRDSTGNPVIRVNSGFGLSAGYLNVENRVPGQTHFLTNLDTIKIVSSGKNISLNSLTFPVSGKRYSVLMTTNTSGNIVLNGLDTGGSKDKVLVYDGTQLIFVSAEHVLYGFPLVTVSSNIVVDTDVEKLRFHRGLKIEQVTPGTVSARLYINELPYDPNPPLASEFLVQEPSTKRKYKTRREDIFKKCLYLVDYRVFGSPVDGNIGISAIYTIPSGVDYLIIEALGAGGGGGGSSNTSVGFGTDGGNGKPTIVEDVDTGGTRIRISAAPGLGGKRGDPAFNPSVYPYLYSRGEATGTNLISHVTFPGTFCNWPDNSPSDYRKRIAGKGGRSGRGTGGGGFVGVYVDGYGAGGAQWGGGGGSEVMRAFNGYTACGGMGGGYVVAEFSSSGVTQLHIEIQDGGLGGRGWGWTLADPRRGGNGYPGMVAIKAYKCYKVSAPPVLSSMRFSLGIPSVMENELPPPSSIVNVNNWTSLRNALTSANPGTHIVLASGYYGTNPINIDNTFNILSTPSAPVVVRASAVGEAVFPGGFNILDPNKSDIWFYGIDFRDMDNNVVRGSRIVYRRCRIWPKIEVSGKAFGIKFENGEYNRVDYSNIRLYTDASALASVGTLWSASARYYGIYVSAKESEYLVSAYPRKVFIEKCIFEGGPSSDNMDSSFVYMNGAPKYTMYAKYRMNWYIYDIFAISPKGGTYVKLANSTLSNAFLHTTASAASITLENAPNNFIYHVETSGVFPIIVKGAGFNVIANTKSEIRIMGGEAEWNHYWATNRASFNTEIHNSDPSKVVVVGTGEPTWTYPAKKTKLYNCPNYTLVTTPGQTETTVTAVSPYPNVSPIYPSAGRVGWYAPWTGIRTIVSSS